MTTENELIQSIPLLIRQLWRGLNWKPGAASRHLLKRNVRHHLPSNASLADYEGLIYRLLKSEDANIYVYYSDDIPYLCVAAPLEERLWLVVASFDGRMETAFVVENPTTYLERPAFRRVGKLGEVMR